MRSFLCSGARALRRTSLDGAVKNSTRSCLAEDLVGEMWREKDSRHFFIIFVPDGTLTR